MRPRGVRTKRAVTVVGIVVASTAVVTIIATRGSDQPGHPNRTHTPAAAAPHQRGSLVLRDGNRVRAFGEIQFDAAGRARLCDPDEVVADAGGGIGSALCDVSVRLTDADPARLAQRVTVKGMVSGTALVSGVWRRDALRVVEQHPTDHDRQQDARLRNTSPTQPPCAPPAGGWPATTAIDHTAYAPLAAVNGRRPGTFIAFNLFHPTPQRTVVFALTHDDPAPLHRELDPTYRGQLCLVRSVYTARQLTTAQADVEAGLDQAGNTVTSAEFDDVSEIGQPRIRIDCVRVTQQLARLAASQPRGLVVFTPWLVPSN